MFSEERTAKVLFKFFHYSVLILPSSFVVLAIASSQFPAYVTLKIISDPKWKKWSLDIFRRVISDRVLCPLLMRILDFFFRWLTCSELNFENLYLFNESESSILYVPYQCAHRFCGKFKWTNARIVLFIRLESRELNSSKQCRNSILNKMSSIILFSFCICTQDLPFHFRFLLVLSAPITKISIKMKVVLLLQYECDHIFLSFCFFFFPYWDETMNEKIIIPAVESVAFPPRCSRRFQIIYSFASFVSFTRFDVHNRFSWDSVGIMIF